MKLFHFAVNAPGNAGDHLLSHSVRLLIDQEWGPQEWEVGNLRDYTSRSVIEEINRNFDGVLLGGGGLFLKDSHPNDNSGWQWNCPVETLELLEKPLALFGVGNNRFRGQDDFELVFSEHINATARKACFIGLRNSGSVESIRGYLHSNQEKLSFQPCTTTLARELYGIGEKGAWEKGARTLGLTLAFDRCDMRFNGMEDQFFYQIFAILDWARRHDWDVKIVNQFNRDMAHPILKELRKIYEVVNTCDSSLQEITRTYNNTALLLGMRGHSQLIPFGVNNAFISLISHNKLQYFLDDIGHPEWGVEVTDRNLAVKVTAIIKHMDESRELVQRQIDEAKMKFWTTTKNNLRALKKHFQPVAKQDSPTVFKSSDLLE